MGEYKSQEIYQENRLLKKNLEDIRNIVEITKEIKRVKEWENTHDIKGMVKELCNKNDIILKMRDALIQVFQYLNNVNKLESFMRNKHDNSLLVLMQIFTIENKDLGELEGELLQLADDYKLLDLNIPKNNEGGLI